MLAVPLTAPAAVLGAVSGTADCRRWWPDEHAVLVGVPFSNSGPGGPALYACLPCARIYARSPLAPDWLTEEIAKTQARASGRGRP
jgi:hypothetical protein